MIKSQEVINLERQLEECEDRLRKVNEEIEEIEGEKDDE